MSQKILASHCKQANAGTGLMEVRVDQVVLAREPNRVFRTAVDAGLIRCAPEVNVAYPPHCGGVDDGDRNPHDPHRVPDDALTLGFLVARAGAGFASVVHLERFASPGRLLLSDEPRLSTCGAAGTLTLPASRAQLTEALLTGHSMIRQPRSVHILISGRLRPFVSARDASLELVRRGLRGVVQAVDSKHQAPVILEFGGPGAKHLSIAERATLCATAAQVGAAGALFGADERTESFLREQRRSKAHRAFGPDTGATWEEVVPLDLASIEPLMMEESGQIRAVREHSGQNVSQVLLGGDTGISLRDCLATAALLKSKRVAPGVDFLLCPPSRQTLEVLSRCSALADLIMSGARLIEPDRRVISGELYRCTGAGLSLRNSDYQNRPSGVVASTETLAYAVAHGTLEDPRAFKRPVRVAVPRNLPTDDVLLARGELARGGARGKGRLDRRTSSGSSTPFADHFGAVPDRDSWTHSTTLLISTTGRETRVRLEDHPQAHVFVALNSEDLRWMVDNASDRPQLRALVADHIPSATVSVLSGLGILALQADQKTLENLAKRDKVTVPSNDGWSQETLSLGSEDREFEVRWLARGAERNWTRTT
jgi:aconitate hydratase